MRIPIVVNHTSPPRKQIVCLFAGQLSAEVKLDQTIIEVQQNILTILNFNFPNPLRSILANDHS